MNKPTIPMHTIERRLKSPGGVEMSDPDQGIPHIAICLNEANVGFRVWHPFPQGVFPEDDETPRGHNIEGFVEVWQRFEDNPEQRGLWTIEPRFGHPQWIPRTALQYHVLIKIEFWPKEDIRAGARLAGLPIIGGLPRGPIRVPVAPGVEVEVRRG